LLRWSCNNNRHALRYNCIRMHKSSKPLVTRRQTMLGAPALWAAALAGPAPADAPRRVPVIDVTDLYHPHQDIGDNVDLIAAYALAEIDLKAVILDVTAKFRRVVATGAGGKVIDKDGPRDPGVIPVLQLNYLFDRNVPYGIGPFEPLRAPGDKLLDAPEFQQAGVRLILDTLRTAREKVHIVSFGSARTIAAAFNREPDLVRARTARIHLCAGCTTTRYLEWNVELDPHAIVALLRSDLPVALYPCASSKGPFSMDSNNTYWRLPDLGFVKKMDSRLQRYLAYAFERSMRATFLEALDHDWPPEVFERIARRPHHVWETAVWIQVSNRRLVHRAGTGYRIVPAGEVLPSDRILPNDLKPCRVQVRDNGLFTWEWSDRPTNFWMYERGDFEENARALREALPALYESFHCGRQ
jgi:pyrimidine-specific ribonucleoside hydrolase